MRRPYPLPAWDDRWPGADPIHRGTGYPEGMRAWSLPFLLLWGCEAASPGRPWSSVADPTVARPEDTGPTDGDGDGWTVAGGDCDDTDPAVHPDAAEACRNGTDDDCDGLLDCEDGDCTRGPDCEESGACADGRDNDDDGLADCLDDECWSEATCVFASRVWQGSRARWHRGRAWGTGLGSGSATSVEGTLRIRRSTAPPSSPDATCTWHADRVTFRGFSMGPGGIWVPHAAYVDRSGFALSPACPVGPAVSAFLPAPFARAGGVAGVGWDTAEERVTSWYGGTPILLTSRVETASGLVLASESSWSMAPIRTGSTFEIGGHPGGE